MSDCSKVEPDHISTQVSTHCPHRYPHTVHSTRLHAQHNKVKVHSLSLRILSLSSGEVYFIATYFSMMNSCLVSSRRTASGERGDRALKVAIGDTMLDLWLVLLILHPFLFHTIMATTLMAGRPKEKINPQLGLPTAFKIFPHRLSN